MSEKVVVALLRDAEGTSLLCSCSLCDQKRACCTAASLHGTKSLNLEQYKNRKYRVYLFSSESDFMSWLLRNRVLKLGLFSTSVVFREPPQRYRIEPGRSIGQILCAWSQYSKADLIRHGKLGHSLIFDGEYKFYYPPNIHQAFLVKGYHNCLPSNWPGFESRRMHTILQSLYGRFLFVNVRDPPGSYRFGPPPTAKLLCPRKADSGPNFERFCEEYQSSKVHNLFATLFLRVRVHL